MTGGPPDDAGVVPMESDTRVATGEDVADLARMHLAALDEATASRGGAALVAEVGRGDAAATEASFREDLGTPRTEVLVATLCPAGGSHGSATVLGYGVLALPSDEAGTDRAGTGRIREIWVEPGARRIGLGTALLEALADLATERGCGYLDSVALPGDRATKNFFEDHAMVARAIVVQRQLPPAGPTGS